MGAILSSVIRRFNAELTSRTDSTSDSCAGGAGADAKAGNAGCVDVVDSECKERVTTEIITPRFTPRSSHHDDNDDDDIEENIDILDERKQDQSIDERDITSVDFAEDLVSGFDNPRSAHSVAFSS
jgi:hypothetical protein